jgi:hypothetical protein
LGEELSIGFYKILNKIIEILFHKFEWFQIEKL